MLSDELKTKNGMAVNVCGKSRDSEEAWLSEKLECWNFEKIRELRIMSCDSSQKASPDQKLIG